MSTDLTPDLGAPKDPRTQDRTSHQPDHELTSLARGGTLTLVGAAASAVLGLVMVLVVGRGLGARGAGLFFEAIALFGIFNNPIGADTGLVRMIPRYRADGRTCELRPLVGAAVWPTLAIGSVAAGLVFAFAPQLDHVFVHGAGAGAGTNVIRATAPFIPAALAMTVALAGTRGLGTMVPFVAVQNVAVPALRPALALGVVVAGLGPTAVALGWGAPLGLGMVAAIGILGILLRRVESDARGAPRRAHRRWRAVAAELWAFSGPQGIASFFQLALLWLDVLLVGALQSTRSAGVYAVASRYILVGAYALQAMGLAIGPQISRLLAERRRGDMENLFQVATWWLIAISWPVYLVMAVFSPVLLRPAGHEFVSGATALSILSLAMLVNIATGNNRTVMLMAGWSVQNLAITAAQLGINIGLNLVLIPRIGFVGAAVSWAATIVLGNVLVNLVLWRRLRLDPLGSGFPLVVLGSVVCFGAIGAVTRAVLGPTVPACCLALGVGVVAYAALLWRWRRRLRLESFRNLVRRNSPVTPPAAVAP